MYHCSYPHYNLLLILFGFHIMFQSACSNLSIMESGPSDHGPVPTEVMPEDTQSFELMESIPDPLPETVYTIQSGDTFLGILQKNGIKNRRNILNVISAIENLSWDVTKIQPNDTITFVDPIDAEPYFTIQITKHQRLLVEYTDPIEATLEEEDTEMITDVVQQHIDSSFWHAASQMKLDANQILHIVKVFETHIDFGSEIYGGENLTIWADRIYLNNEPIGIKRLYSVIFENRKGSTQMYQVELDNKMVWLDKQGRSVNRPFLRSPVEYNHISSKFGVKRKTGYHGGVDFAARKGVPVRAVANGKVKLASWNGGYGKQVQLQHTEYGPYLTSYAHLSEIKVKKGRTVKQGDIIGLVGSTGNSTGPHVHFELKVKGKRVNPLEYTLPNAHEITPEQLKPFQKQIAVMELQFLSLQTSEVDTP